MEQFWSICRSASLAALGLILGMSTHGGEVGFSQFAHCEGTGISAQVYSDQQVRSQGLIIVHHGNHYDRSTTKLKIDSFGEGIVVSDNAFSLNYTQTDDSGDEAQLKVHGKRYDVVCKVDEGKLSASEKLRRTVRLGIQSRTENGSPAPGLQKMVSELAARALSVQYQSIECQGFQSPVGNKDAEVGTCSFEAHDTPTRGKSFRARYTLTISQDIEHESADRQWQVHLQQYLYF